MFLARVRRRPRRAHALLLALTVGAAAVVAMACGGESSSGGVTVEPITASPTARATRIAPTAPPPTQPSPTPDAEVGGAEFEPTETPIPPPQPPPDEQAPITTPPPPAPTATVASGVPPPPPPTGSLAGQRIYTNGDSTSYFVSVGVLSLAVAQGAVQIQPAAEFKLSSGLLGGASFDWQAYLASEMEAYTPDIVVFMVGANDAHVGMDLAAYAAKVGQMMDQLNNRRLIWVGQPNMGRPDLAASVLGMNKVFAAEAAKRPWVRYVDTWSLTSDANGAFTPYTPDGSLARGDDGVHFTSAGGAYLAHAVIAAIVGG